MKDNKKSVVQQEKPLCNSCSNRRDRVSKACKFKQNVSEKNIKKEKNTEPIANDLEQNKEILKGQKSVKELVEILENKLDSSNINNIKYCEQDFHFQRETLRFLKKKGHFQ